MAQKPLQIQVTGLKESLRELQKIDPEIRREFSRSVRQITKPVVDEAKSTYWVEALSGMSQPWNQRGRDLLPYDQGDARQGVKTKVSTAKKNRSLVAIVQQNPAAAIIEIAGKRNANPAGDNFNQNLTDKFGPPMRVMWPALDKNLKRVEREVGILVQKTESRIQNRLRFK
jgi:hypothetical protein